MGVYYVSEAGDGAMGTFEADKGDGGKKWPEGRRDEDLEGEGEVVDPMGGWGLLEDGPRL